MANRYLAGDVIRPRLVWKNVRAQIILTPSGLVVFDDTVIDKNSSRRRELVRSQYSGNTHRIIKGIGVVTCVYVNPHLNQFWVIDYRIYDPNGDGKTKLDPVQDRLQNGVYQKCLPMRAVVMDTWYATKGMMLQIEKFEKIYYCPLKSNRPVDDSGGAKPYQRVDGLAWTKTEPEHGKTIKIKAITVLLCTKIFKNSVEHLRVNSSSVLWGTNANIK
jgi:hypothetical protein